jgi:alpha-amylase/alpha-mannosidase (GH57 family)
MHQPSYRDPVTGEVTLPWVRLHGVKDYSDMAVALGAVPGAKATVNWVPGLLDQCDALGSADYGQRERFWRLTERDAADLSPTDIAFIRQHFFSLGTPMLEPWPRYRQLRDKVRSSHPLTLDELRDLQVWFNLAWTGVAVRTEDPTVAALFAKGRDFDEQDKKTLLEAQRRAVLNLVPRWRTLADSGAVELTASPHYHPILPLLIDTDLARQADPSTPLPDSRLRMPQDAAAHIRRAMASHTRRFGAPPRGMWPSEGSVTGALLPIAHELGVSWLATDESILWKSLGGSSQPNALRPTDKFVPWTLDGVSLVFRDHGLSDKIGFVYANWPLDRAYSDFVHALTTIERTTRNGGDHLVVIALDGENCWEHYPGGVTRFLPGLLERIQQTPNLILSTMSEALAAVPARPLQGLATGSWIDGTFRTWLGDPVKNKAWELLTAARHAVATPLQHLLSTEPGLADLVMRAEASDWWWWFGEGHSSTFDLDFDALFRAHLMAIWLALGKPIPDVLHQSIYALAKATPTPASTRRNKRPMNLIEVVIDGRRGWYFKWVGSGEVHQNYGSIHRAESLISRLRYGNDADHLYLCLEASETCKTALADTRVELQLTGPGQQATLTIWPPPSRPTDAPSSAGSSTPAVTSACEDVLEVRIPLRLLTSTPLPYRLYGILTLIELVRPSGDARADASDRSDEERPLERFPGTGELEFELLSPLDAALNTGV